MASTTAYSRPRGPGQLGTWVALALMAPLPGAKPIYDGINFNWTAWQGTGRRLTSRSSRSASCVPSPLRRATGQLNPNNTVGSRRHDRRLLEQRRLHRVPAYGRTYSIANYRRNPRTRSPTPSPWVSTTPGGINQTKLACERAGRRVGSAGAVYYAPDARGKPHRASGALTTCNTLFRPQ